MCCLMYALLGFFGYANSVDQTEQDTMKNYDVIGARFGSAQIAPPTTILGVTQLAIGPLMFEIEVTAAD